MRSRGRAVALAAAAAIVAVALPAGASGTAASGTTGAIGGAATGTAVAEEPAGKLAQDPVLVGAARRFGLSEAALERALVAVKTYLAGRFGAEAAERIPIVPLVVFTHPRATLSVEEPTVATVHVREARSEVRRLISGTKIPGDIARRLEYELVQDAAVDGAPVSVGEAVDRKPRRRLSRPTRAR